MVSCNPVVVLAVVADGKMVEMLAVDVVSFSDLSEIGDRTTSLILVLCLGDRWSENPAAGR